MKFSRSSFVPKGAVKVADKASSGVAYIYSGPDRGRPGETAFYAVAFHGKAQKPDFHYRYRTAASRDKSVADHFRNQQAHEQRRKDAAAKRKAFVHNVQVGDIYRTSWGYDQTNVEFFQVVEIRGKHAILREVESAVEARGQGCESVVAQSDAFLKPRYNGDDRGLPIRRLIQEGHIKIDDVRTAWPWGKRIAGVVVGDACHQTASGWGH